MNRQEFDIEMLEHRKWLQTDQAEGTRRAQLRNEDLSGLAFETEQLAGIDLKGVTLPENVDFGQLLEQVTETTKSAKKLFQIMLVTAAYSLLAVANTPGADLLVDSGKLLLPLLGISVPTREFFLVIPATLLGMYFYTHLYLQRNWEVIATLPAVFPDGRPFIRVAYPWIMNGLAWRNVKSQERPMIAFDRLQVLTAWVLAWLVVPLVIIYIWLRFLVVHDYFYTSQHILILGFCSQLFWVQWWNARRTLRGKFIPPFRLRYDLRSWRFARRLALLIAGMGLLCFVSRGAIDGRPTNRWSEITGISTAVPFLMDRLPLPLPIEKPFVNFKELDVSTKPDSWIDGSSDISLVRGATLNGRDLRWAQASKAFLAKANLSSADLSHADLSSADLRGANFEGAILFHADLHSARLEHAKNLKYLQLNAARNYILAFLSPELISRLNLPEDHNKRLGDKSLSGYNFTGIDLCGTDLAGYDLRYVSFKKADLDSTRFVKANVQNADFRGASKMSAVQVQTARNYKLAYYDDNLLDSLVLPADHNYLLLIGDLREHDFFKSDLGEADLRDYKFGERAQFRHAWLYGANLTDVSLNGANLTYANLTGALLVDADLTGAALVGTKFGGAELGGAKIEEANVQNANFRGAVGLEASKISSAWNYRLAYYDSKVLQDLGLKPNHNARLAARDLRKYSFESNQMTGADLTTYDLEDADFHESTLPMAIFKDANLEKANFKGATLSWAKFTGANLRSVDFSEADLTQAVLTDADIQLAKFHGAQGLDFSQLKDARNYLLGFYSYDKLLFDSLGLKRDHNKRLKSKPKDLSDYDFTLLDMKNADLSGFDLRRAKFDRTILDGANLQGADLRGLNSRYVTHIKKARNFALARYDSTLLSVLGLPPDHDSTFVGNQNEHDYREYDFSGHDMTGADMEYFNLQTALFIGTTLKGAILAGTNLSGADLTGAKGLTATQIKSATIDTLTRLPEYLENLEKK